MKSTVSRTAILATRDRSGVITERREVALSDDLSQRFELGEILGTGSMSTVYRARDLLNAKDVAFKLLMPAASAAHTRAYADEARLLRQVQHENVLRVLDAGVVDGCAWLATELAAGGTLEALLASRKRLGESEALRIALDLLSGLRVAHGEGIVHRDIKPANVMFTAAGRALVGDFGIARQYGDEDPWDTETGYLFGTPLYMAPEQLALQPAAVASDLWAVGVLLHEMISGAAPFQGDTIVEVQARQAELPPELDCSRETRAAVAGALRPIAERWQLATIFGAALGDVLDRREPEIRDWAGEAYRPAIMPRESNRVRMALAVPDPAEFETEREVLDRLLLATGACRGYFYLVTAAGGDVRPALGRERRGDGCLDSNVQVQEELVLHAVRRGWPKLCEVMPFTEDGNLGRLRFGIIQLDEASALAIPVRESGVVTALYALSSGMMGKRLRRADLEAALRCLGLA